MLDKLNRSNLLKVGFYASILFFALTIVFTICCKQTGMDSGTLFGVKLFSDFAETLAYCVVDNPYDGSSSIISIYPPIAFLMFYPFALICKGSLLEMVNGTLPLETIYQNKVFVFSFVLYFIINMALILFFLAKISKLKGKELMYLLGITLCFGPFIYTFGRANVIITAVLFFLIFFWLYNSESKIKRELANLSLAVTISLKIYPIILIIIFFKDKRFKDLLKTLGYSLVLLLLPFLLIQGGFNNIGEILNNFGKFNGGEARHTHFSNISLDSLWDKIGILVNVDLRSSLSSITRWGLLLVSFLVLLICSKNSKKDMQCMVVAICTYELWQGVSYGYTMAFLIVPLIMYLLNFESLSKVDKCYYGVCYVIIGFQVTYALKIFVFQSLCLVCLVVKAIIDLLVEKFHLLNAKNAM